MVRAYCVGACLLDKDDPSVVLAHTAHRCSFLLLCRSAADMVPNVVYSCGALIRIAYSLPFAVGDRCTTFATGSVDLVLETMVSVE